MPSTRRKPIAHERTEFQTIFPDEFQRWLCYELANAAKWNPGKITLTSGFNTWRCAGPGWTIEWNADGSRKVLVTTNEATVRIRKGLWINTAVPLIEVQGDTAEF